VTDRLAQALEAIVNAILPSLAAYLQWEYRVVDVTPGLPVRISATPVETSGQFACPFGPQANIQLWPGPSGGYSTPVVGSLVLLAFNDGNPAKPRIAGLDPTTPPLGTKFGQSPTPLVPTPWGSELASALTTFSGGLNPTTLAAQATTLHAALALLPSPATTVVQAE
jgi:hypothetical protein